MLTELAEIWQLVDVTFIQIVKVPGMYFKLENSYFNLLQRGQFQYIFYTNHRTLLYFHFSHAEYTIGNRQKL